MLKNDQTRIKATYRFYVPIYIALAALCGTCLHLFNGHRPLWCQWNVFVNHTAPWCDRRFSCHHFYGSFPIYLHMSAILPFHGDTRRLPDFHASCIHKSDSVFQIFGIFFVGSHYNGSNSICFVCSLCRWIWFGYYLYGDPTVFKKWNIWFHDDFFIFYRIYQFHPAIYAAISLGQFVRDHRVIASISFYAAIYTVQQIVSLVVLIPVMISTNLFSEAASLNYSDTGMLTIISLIISVVFSVIFYVISERILDRKLNLPWSSFVIKPH